MRNWDITDETGNCTVNEDLRDAEWICSKLGIQLHEVNFVKEYWNEVFRYKHKETDVKILTFKLPKGYYSLNIFSHYQII